MQNYLNQTKRTLHDKILKTKKNQGEDVYFKLLSKRSSFSGGYEGPQDVSRYKRPKDQQNS